MIIKVSFGGDYNTDYIEVPSDINLKKYEIRDKFYNWIDNTEEEHPFWEYENGIRIGLNYRGNAIVYWLNNCILKDAKCKSKLIESFSNKSLDYDLMIKL
ncbi:hypothetical protein KW95_13890 [Clostridioides difficile]|nr:hypothetical protein KW95_13890 [Clostridioides difficile]